MRNTLFAQRERERKLDVGSRIVDIETGRKGYVTNIIGGKIYGVMKIDEMRGETRDNLSPVEYSMDDEGITFVLGLKKKAQEEHKELTPEELEALEEAPYAADVYQRAPDKEVWEVTRQNASDEVGKMMIRAMELKQKIGEIEGKVKLVMSEAKEKRREIEKAIPEKQQELDEILDVLSEQMDTLGNNVGMVVWQYQEAMAMLQKGIVGLEAPPKNLEFYQQQLEHILKSAKEKDMNLYRAIVAWGGDFERKYDKANSVMQVLKKFIVFPFKPKKRGWVTEADLRGMVSNFIGVLKGLWDWAIQWSKKFLGLAEEVDEFEEDVQNFIEKTTETIVEGRKEDNINRAIDIVLDKMDIDPSLNFEEAYYFASEEEGFPLLDEEGEERIEDYFRQHALRESRFEQSVKVMRPIDDVEKFSYIKRISRLIDKFNQRIAEVGRVTDRRVKKFLIEKVSNEGKIKEGHVEYSLQLNLPRYKRKVQVVVPFSIEDDEVNADGVFVSSVGDQYTLDTQGIKKCMKLEDFTEERMPRRRSRIKRSQELDIGPAQW